jgi:hypothetical protein
MSSMSYSCPHCEQVLEVDAEMAGQDASCPTCEGDIQLPAAPAADEIEETQEVELDLIVEESPASEKRRLVAFLLCFLLGGLSVHRFYVGKTGSAIAQTLTFGGLGLWLFIDLIMILTGKFRDKSGLPISEW